MPLTNAMMPTGAVGLGGAAWPPAPYPGGAIIYVNSATGRDVRGRVTFQGTAATVTASRSAQGPWGDPNFPLASVFGPNGALSLCQAGRGDLIIVAPNHSENLATGAAISIPGGVTVIGCGYGNARPKFIATDLNTFLQFNAAGVMMQNCIIDLTGVATALGLAISASGVQLVNVRIIQATAVNQAATAIQLLAGADDFAFINSEIDGVAGACTQAILTSGASLINRFEMANSFIHGNYSAACLKVGAAGNALKELLIYGCTLQQTGTVVPVFVWDTASTGTFENCTFGTKATAGPPTVATISGSPPVGLAFTQCFATDGNTAAARSGLLAPAATTL